MDVSSKKFPTLLSTGAMKKNIKKRQPTAKKKVMMQEPVEPVICSRSWNYETSGDQSSEAQAETAL
ncbi:hypothetical protein Pint_30305 [Pistacia integerrima]|uniref:Uncharacterized protein n=1 Tax=Pistacia integerrima TaxID=434235 RepID=A0ACC0X0H3_9ROSI|nr:hypothetical protein Pint_30305 [Pistacia integerrima]